MPLPGGNHSVPFLSKSMKGSAEKGVRAMQEDEALVRAFQGGDRAAFDGLVLKHKDRMVNLCYWFLGDYQEADDAAQETFIKVFRSLKRFRFEATFSTWLYRIAVNTCKNRRTSREYRQRRETIPLENPGVSGQGNPSNEIADRFPSPQMELEKKERWIVIRRAIDTLPEEQRMVVTLRDIEGLSYDEIVKVTGFNLGTVKSKLARARLGLREKLRGVL